MNLDKNEYKKNSVEEKKYNINNKNILSKKNKEILKLNEDLRNKDKENKILQKKIKEFEQKANKHDKLYKELKQKN